MSHGFLPISKEDMKEAGIEQLDFVYICGDAYVDHPSFGHAIISRILEAHGYKVGIIAQPDWKDRESINRLGEHGSAFLFQPEIWTLWSIIIPFPRKEEPRMHLHRAV